MATPRLKEKYNNEVRDKLYKELELTNVNQVPRLEKIVVNMGVGRVQRSPSQVSICVKVRQSVRRSPFVAIACGSSSTVSCPPRFLACVTSAV